jgi:hypothetical protein
MTYYSPRHSTTDKDPERAARQSSENARDVTEALGRKLSAHTTTVPRYIASGSTSARVVLEASAVRPLAVVLIHAAPADDLSGSVALAPSFGFRWSPTSASVEVPEPEGLEAGKAYYLVYLVVEV